MLLIHAAYRPQDLSQDGSPSSAGLTEASILPRLLDPYPAFDTNHRAVWDLSGAGTTVGSWIIAEQREMEQKPRAEDGSLKQTSLTSRYGDPAVTPR